LRQQAKQKATPVFESMKKVIEDWNFQCPEAKQAELEIRKLFQQAESLYRRDTYFDCLDALPLLEKAQQIFDPIPQKEAQYQRRKLETERRRKEETERRKKEEEERQKEERRKREAEEAERERKEQELREYRLKNKLCLACGAKLSFWNRFCNRFRIDMHYYFRRHRK